MLILSESNKNLSRYLFINFVKIICNNTRNRSVHVTSCFDLQSKWNKIFSKITETWFNFINFALNDFFDKNLWDQRSFP